MQYTWDQIQFATYAVHFLPVIGVVAFIALAAKSRIVFLVGSAGATLGWLLTGSLLPMRFSTGGTIERLELGAQSILINSVFCSAVGLGILALVYRFRHRHDFQFSLRAMFVLTTLVCVIAWLIHTWRVATAFR